MGSVWEIASTAVEGVRPAPPASGHWDVAIVGAGVTGLTAALQLAEAGQRVIVVEAWRVGEGSTGHSTGNLYSTLAHGLTPIARKWGNDVTRAVVEARAQAVDRVEETAGRLGIDCDFRRCALHFASAAADGAREEWLRGEQNAARDAGIEAGLTDRPPLPFAAPVALRLERQAQFNPLRYCQGLAAAVAARGGAVHEHSPVIAADTDRGRITVGEAEISASALVQATHTPKGVSMLQTALLPYREYGIAARLNSAAYPDGQFWMLDTGHSIRGYRHNDNDYLVAVGEKHKTGDGPAGADPYERLRDYLRARFDVAGFEHGWSAQQFTAADRLPYIGRAPGTSATYVGTGYAADGLVWGTVAGTVIADLVLGREDARASLFSPTRLTPAKSAREWLKENVGVATHFARDRLSREQIDSVGEVAAGEGRVASIGGQKLAICRDAGGQLSVLSAVCPHMKCLVHWNGADGTWDCPCHGSRFRADGSVIEGPAYQGLAPRAVHE